MPVFSTRGGNKGAHGRYVRDYQVLVDRLLMQQSRDHAMLTAVGGSDQVGDQEFAAAVRFGFAERGYLVDVGCGSGRLARRIARLPEARFLGTDVNPKLLQYAADSCKRPDFKFAQVDSTQIPEADSTADMVTFFSVGTHMLHEEFFLYLEEARRVLKSGGRTVFSFLDAQTPHGRAVFSETIAVVRNGGELDHLNVFIGRSDVPVWAAMLAMKLVDIIPGDAPWAGSDSAAERLVDRDLAGQGFGQSIAVLEKI